MKKLFSIFLLMPLLCAAQATSTMRFEGGDVWDFGNIEEVKGPVEHTFRYTNSGRIAFVIENVSVDCGCTSVEHTTEPVQPKATGSITLRFDPKDQDGPFEKSVRIMSKGGRNRNVLTIKGNVVPRPRSVEELYPFSLSEGVRLSRLTYNIGYLELGTTHEVVAEVINLSPSTVRLGWDAVPMRNFLRVDAPETLAPGMKAKIKVMYDMRGIRFYGRYSDKIFLTLNGVRQHLPLSLTYIAVDRANESAEAPDAVIAPLFEYHGTARRGSKLTRTLEISNDGTATLIVRWIGLRPGMTTSLREGQVVQP